MTTQAELSPGHLAGFATAISATVGTGSMFAGGVIGESELANFWRTWWLGDTAGTSVERSSLARRRSSVG